MFDDFTATDRDDDGDTRALALFREYLEASRAADQYEDAPEDDPDHKAAEERVDQIEEAIIATPGGPIALALKAYLYLRMEFNAWVPERTLMRDETLFVEGGPHFGKRLDISILRDAAKQVPELAELAAPIIHEDAPLIEADIDVQYCREMLREADLGTPVCGISDAEARSDAKARLAKALDRIENTPAATERGTQIKARHAARGARKPELRARCEAIAAEFDPATLPDGDAGLIEAERRLHEVLRLDKSLYRDFGEITPDVENEIIIAILDPVRERLRELVEQTRPSGLAGVAAKLRLLTDPTIGIIVGEPSEGDITCLKQVAEFVEREAGS